ncbi:cadherin-like protein 26, partial [Clarias magur]
TETSLISLKMLSYGNYTVPLKIVDQQGVVAQNVLQVMVCDCEKGDVCRRPKPISTRLHGAALGILLGSLLLMI